jgi:NitT/TauT family transport system substrate-binding protein
LRYDAAFGIARIVSSVCIGFAIAVGAAYAQPRAPAFGKPGESIHLVVGFQPYYVLTWTAAIARDKEFWRKHLPAGSRVELNVAIRGPAHAAVMRAGKLHIGYIGDAAGPLAAAKESDIRLIAVAALSQDQCVMLASRDAPEFTSPSEAIRWLSGKRIAVLPGTCMERITRAAFEREGVKPAQMLNLGREELHAAFGERRLDAAAVSEPGASHLVADGLARRIYSSLSLGQWDGGFIAVPAAFLAGRPDIVRGWLAAELEAQRFLADPRNADEAIRIVAAHAVGVPEAALRLALYGAYPEKQGGSAVRLTFPFTFSGQAMSAIRGALKLAQARDPQPAGELRSEAIQSGFAEELLRARGLKSPLGEVRARADLVPR